MITRARHHRRFGMMWIRVIVTAVVGATASCAGPTHGDGDYTLKMASTAGALGSSAQTVVMAAGLAADNRGFRPYISDVISQAEDDATSVQETFDSRQPPTADSDALRQRADQTFEKVVSAITDARVAARSDDSAGLASSAQQLRKLIPDLQKLQQAST
jgi:hypothetical protein